MCHPAHVPLSDRLRDLQTLRAEVEEVGSTLTARTAEHASVKLGLEEALGIARNDAAALKNELSGKTLEIQVRLALGMLLPSFSFFWYKMC